MVRTRLPCPCARFFKVPRLPAFKCNPDPKVADTLAAAGIGFDCASKNEITEVLARNVAPDRIVYAHPCKSLSHLRYAKDVGVAHTVFDNEDEVREGLPLPCVEAA